MSHEPYSDLAPAHALGALDREERLQFERHLSDRCVECERALLEYRESLVALATELQPVAPPPSVKAALLRRIEAGARPARALELPRPRWSRWRFIWAAALAAAAVIVGYLGLTVNALDRELARRAEEVATLRAQVAQQRQLLNLLRAPETRIVALDGLTPSPTAKGQMWWHREAGGFFVASGLPRAPSGKTYQLWVIAGGKPMSAGIFDVDQKGSGTLQVTPLPVETVEMFAVTMEPAGGLPQPSGEMYLAGKV
jgi:anti-sigma-K factor RskA